MRFGGFIKKRSLFTYGELGDDLKAALSQNELETLDRQVATIDYQLGEIANLLESRVGAATELAASARAIQKEFARLARQIHVQTAMTGKEAQTGNRSASA